MTFPSARSRVTLPIAALALLAACGSSVQKAEQGSTTAATTAVVTTTTTATGTASFPVTIKAANGDVTIAAKPVKIVSLSPTATEMLFAIGAGKQVIAVDDQSTFPADAPRTDLSGFKPNVEAIAQKQPDLVVISDDSQKLSDALGALKIPTLLEGQATTLDGIYAQIAQLGTATGHDGEAKQVVADMAKGIDAAVVTAGKRTKALTYYYELDPTYYTATAKTFIGQVFAKFGLVNIGDAADDGSGYPQLSAEKIVAANPDVVFLADVKCCQQTAGAVSARPGWNVITAVKDKHVVALDDDIASRWGPRVVDLASSIAAALAAIPAS
jgi:iron complex transport system substrate-binding protein